MKVVQIRPEYGELQCQWAAQFAMADTPDTDSGETLNNKQAEIQKWFLSDHAMSDSKGEDLTIFGSLFYFNKISYIPSLLDYVV